MPWVTEGLGEPKWDAVGVAEGHGGPDLVPALLRHQLGRRTKLLSRQSALCFFELKILFKNTKHMSIKNFDRITFKKPMITLTWAVSPNRPSHYKTWQADAHLDFPITMIINRRNILEISKNLLPLKKFSWGSHMPAVQGAA